MKLGGFVIHGSNADTLGACLDDLAAVCDEVVAVDSGSTDGSADLVRAKGVRAVHHPWEGYGAARAVAVRALAGCDYLFFLDSDECLAAGGRAALAAWRSRGPRARYYTVLRDDIADLDGRRFTFRTETRKRLLRADAPSWRREMLVHEALPADPSTEPTAVRVEHRFATSLSFRASKEERYALLWALEAHAAGVRSKPVVFQQPAHFVRNAVIKGALLRGGAAGARLAWTVAANHRRKYELLREIEQGAHAGLVALVREGRFRELFEQLPRHEAA